MIALFCLLVGLVGGQENPDLDESEGSGAGDDDEYAANTTYVRFNYTGRIRPWPVPAGITEVRELLVTITRTAKFMPPGVHLGPQGPVIACRACLGSNPSLRLSCWLTRPCMHMSWACSRR